MKPKYSVLVIDDQDNWRELLTEILSVQFDVVVAGSYQQALEVLESRATPFHVVVTDMRLVDGEAGNEDGLKIVAHLNQMGDETKTIVITGYATIDSAKRALSRLVAYDYLEKRPSDGSALNVEELKKIVYLAAQEAEAKRPNGFRDLKRSILLLEPDPDWREWLRTILAESHYLVDSPEIAGKEAPSLPSDPETYALILINESVAEKKLLDRLQDTYPESKIVILNTRDIDPIFKAMRDYPVVTAFNLTEGKFDSRVFREFIHSALAEGAVKYVNHQIALEGMMVHASSLDSVYELQLGKTYTVSLSIQDGPAIDSQRIWLLPRQVKKGEVHLHLFIHAERMKVSPAVDGYWHIPLSSERPRSFEFSITPQSGGENELTIELDHDRRWLGRIAIKTRSAD